MTTIDKVMAIGKQTTGDRRRLRRLATIAVLTALTVAAASCGTGADASAEPDSADSSSSDAGGDSTGTTSLDTTSDVDGGSASGDAVPTSNPNQTSDGDDSDDNDSSDDNHGSDDNDESDGDDPESMTPEQREAALEAAAEFSQCVRDQGVPLPDLGILEDGSLDLTGLLESVDPQDPTVKRAILDCQGSLGPAMFGSLNRLLNNGTFDDVLLEFSDCVEAQGYEVKPLSLTSLITAMFRGDDGPDARGVEGSVDPILAKALGLDPDDVDVLNAVDACAADIQTALLTMDLDGAGS